MCLGLPMTISEWNTCFPNEHSLEFRAGSEELLVFGVGAEAHDMLDTGAVVPAPVE